MARQRVRRLGPLQGQQRVFIQMVQRDIIGQRFAQGADIVPLGRAVDHQIKRIGPARNHQIIKHAAILIKQQRIALLTEFERGEINRQHRFDRRVQIGAGQQQLAHVADIEQARILARPVVFGDDAPGRPGIVDRHVIARKRHHPRAAFPVPRIQRQRIKRQVFEMFVKIFWDIVVGHLRSSRQNTAVRRACRHRHDPAPSVG